MARRVQRGAASANGVLGAQCDGRGCVHDGTEDCTGVAGRSREIGPPVAWADARIALTSRGRKILRRVCIRGGTAASQDPSTLAGSCRRPW